MMPAPEVPSKPVCPLEENKKHLKQGFSPFNVDANHVAISLE